LALLVQVIGGASPSASIVVHADAVLVADLSPALVGHGLEDVNHELVGGISTNAVFGESFEEPAGPGGVSGAAGGAVRATWAALAPVPPQCAFSVAVGDAFNGAQAQIITASSPAASACGLANRGLDSGGLSFRPGVAYEVQLFARRLSGAAPPPQLTLALFDAASAAVVASATLVVESASWTRFAATLVVPAAFAGTVCAQDAAPLVQCHANAEALCISCSGSLTIALPAGAAGSVALDQVSLVAQSGGPGPADGLAAASRRDVAALIGAEGFGGVPGMALTALRLGGSMTNAAAYLWKTFRGPPELRPPYLGTWYSAPSSSRFGYFEFLQLCEATPSVKLCVVSMNSAESLQDVTDFVEYAYGDASTTWGAKRAADGHASPYRPFAIEIGNEQEHTQPAWITQVSAFARTIAAAATHLGLAFKIPTLFGVMYGTWPPSQILPLAAAVSGPAFAPLDLMLDFHIGGDSTSDAIVAFNFIASVRAELANVSSSIRGAVLEENGGRHDMQRALGHARNSNRLHCLGDFVRIETAANGLQVAGRNDNDWDQGALFITQNSTYIAPHGMVNIVLGAAAEAALVAVEAAGLAGAPTLDVIAVVDAARSVVTVRAVNFGSASVDASVALLGCDVAAGGAAGSVVMLNASSPTAQNLPWAPLLVAPSFSGVVVSAKGAFDFAFPPYSVVSISVPCGGGGRVERRGLGDVPTTCNAPGDTSNITVFGHVWRYYNGAPWAVEPASLAVACSAAAANCFDEVITGDAPLPSSGTASVTVTFPSQSATGDDDAGLLLRCGTSGVGPGMDAFSCCAW